MLTFSATAVVRNFSAYSATKCARKITFICICMYIQINTSMFGCSYNLCVPTCVKILEKHNIWTAKHDISGSRIRIIEIPKLIANLFKTSFRPFKIWFWPKILI